MRKGPSLYYGSICAECAHHDPLSLSVKAVLSSKGGIECEGGEATGMLFLGINTVMNAGPMVKAEGRIWERAVKVTWRRGASLQSYRGHDSVRQPIKLVTLFSVTSHPLTLISPTPNPTSHRGNFGCFRVGLESRLAINFKIRGKLKYPSFLGIHPFCQAPQNVKFQPPKCKMAASNL